ncbi:hypothetical protein SKAU_G00173000 [Synaphobranchus kaupii]|uniref:Uncharacterized protein n=1 Tax=Synaphobranchus kaupii TaxID=118154 RepID=A0A9Q1FKT1_SYNKA|nr:hypothetical protein SKAU_G00173000 [Synaphobranchus kaupii]
MRLTQSQDSVTAATRSRQSRFLPGPADADGAGPSLPLQTIPPCPGEAGNEASSFSSARRSSRRTGGGVPPRGTALTDGCDCGRRCVTGLGQGGACPGRGNRQLIVRGPQQLSPPSEADRRGAGPLRALAQWATG